MPILNFILKEINGFMDKYIAHIPDDKKMEFRMGVEDLIIKGIEASSKGMVEGAKNDSGR